MRHQQQQNSIRNKYIKLKCWRWDGKQGKSRHYIGFRNDAMCLLRGCCCDVVSFLSLAALSVCGNLIYMLFCDSLAATGERKTGGLRKSTPSSPSVSLELPESALINTSSSSTSSVLSTSHKLTNYFEWKWKIFPKKKRKRKKKS